MTKEKPSELEPLETETLYFIEQCKEFPFRDQWVIYSNTKYGKKIFQNFYSEETALMAAKTYKLTLQKD